LRILGIDLGEKRIGISISDELGITAQGLPTINSINEVEDLKNIKEIIDKHGVEKIILEDERLSTSKAEKFLIETDRSRKKRKKVIDKMSAVIILQSFLDRRMMNKEIKK